MRNSPLGAGSAAPPRVALVFPVRTRADSFFGFVMPSLGLERLGAAIEDVADVALFDARFERDLVAAVVAFRPTVIALNVKTTMRCRESYAVAARLHAALPGATIVLGGLHASSAPLEALEYGDFVVRGEGEEPFRRLVLGDPPEDIPGLAWRGPDGPTLNPMGRPACDLDHLRPPARHLRKPHYRYEAAGAGFKVDLLETSRGCTHACSFCSPASIYPHQYRVHSPGYVLAEVRRLAEAGVKYVMVTDDHLGGDLARVERLCDLIIESGVKMAFFAFIRAFAGKMALKRKMVEAGFVMVSYGAENPSAEQLRRYGKGYPADGGAFLRQVNAEWLEAGACYVGNSYVFGDVRDSRETLEGLGAYARRLDPTFVEPIYAQPYPNTRYRAELEAEGQLRGRDWPDYTEGRLLVKHPELDEEQLRRLRARMWVDFFSPRKAAMGALLVPLHLHDRLGIGRLAVLRYMRATAYALGGCILEEKFYADLYPEMVEDWFRRALPTFEPEELDMTPHAEPFTRMLGLGWLKRLAGELELVVAVTEGPTTLASAVCALSGGQVARAHVVAGALPPAAGRRRLKVSLPLAVVARALGGGGWRRSAGAVRRATAGVAAAIALAALPLLTGCPAAPPAPAASVAPHLPGTIRIVGTDFDFQPRRIEVPLGQPVRYVFENRGSIAHDWVVGDRLHLHAAPGEMAVTTYTFADAGEHPVVCSFPSHQAFGMTGAVVATSALTFGPRAADAVAAPTHPIPSGVTRLPLPAVAPPVPRRAPTTVAVALEAREVVGLVDDQVATTFWTFNGTVPGPMVRVRAGDTVDLKLTNMLGNTESHSIDLHAAQGPGGGGAATQVAPGQTASLAFQARTPGVYVYHCATPKAAHHLASGMYGLIVVEPEAGWPKVDREFYVMQGDMYLDGGRGVPGLQGPSFAKNLDERPDYVVFNGSVGALSGPRALQAETGETVRIFFGVGGPNLTSSFHVVGEVFDRVWREGGADVARDVQTTLVPAGGATVVEFLAEVPGAYMLVDHSLGRAAKGAVGLLEVAGAARPDLFKPGVPAADGHAGHTH